MPLPADLPVAEPQEISRDDVMRMVDDAARQHLGMSGAEFIEAWSAGEFDDDQDRPEVMRVVTLLPGGG